MPSSSLRTGLLTDSYPLLGDDSVHFSIASNSKSNISFTTNNDDFYDHNDDDDDYTYSVMGSTVFSGTTRSMSTIIKSPRRNRDYNQYNEGTDTVTSNLEDDDDDDDDDTDVIVPFGQLPNMRQLSHVLCRIVDDDAYSNDRALVTLEQIQRWATLSDGTTTISNRAINSTSTTTSNIINNNKDDDDLITRAVFLENFLQLGGVRMLSYFLEDHFADNASVVEVLNTIFALTCKSCEASNETLKKKRLQPHPQDDDNHIDNDHVVDNSYHTPKTKASKTTGSVIMNDDETDGEILRIAQRDIAMLLVERDTIETLLRSFRVLVLGHGSSHSLIKMKKSTKRTRFSLHHEEQPPPVFPLAPTCDDRIDQLFDEMGDLYAFCAATSSSKFGVTISSCSIVDFADEDDDIRDDGTSVYTWRSMYSTSSTTAGFSTGTSFFDTNGTTTTAPSRGDRSSINSTRFPPTDRSTLANKFIVVLAHLALYATPEQRQAIVRTISSAILSIGIGKVGVDTAAAATTQSPSSSSSVSSKNEINAHNGVSTDSARLLAVSTMACLAAVMAMNDGGNDNDRNSVRSKDTAMPSKDTATTATEKSYFNESGSFSSRTTTKHDCIPMVQLALQLMSGYPHNNQIAKMGCWMLQRHIHRFTLMERKQMGLVSVLGAILASESQPQAVKEMADQLLEDEMKEKAASEKAAAEIEAAAEMAVTMKAAEEKAAVEKVAAEKAADEKAATEKAAEEKAAAEKAAVFLAAAEKAAAKRAAAQKAAAVKAATEKAATEKAVRDMAAAEKAAAEKATTEKAAREMAAFEETTAAKNVTSEQVAEAEAVADGRAKKAAANETASLKAADTGVQFMNALMEVTTEEIELVFKETKQPKIQPKTESIVNRKPLLMPIPPKTESIVNRNPLSMPMSFKKIRVGKTEKAPRKSIVDRRKVEMPMQMGQRKSAALKATSYAEGTSSYGSV